MGHLRTAYRFTEAQLAAAQAWLERSRVWLAAHPEADAYPCECGACRQLELEGCRDE